VTGQGDRQRCITRRAAGDDAETGTLLGDGLRLACRSCTGYVDAIGDLSIVRERDTDFVLISRAPLANLICGLATYVAPLIWLNKSNSKLFLLRENHSI